MSRKIELVQKRGAIAETEPRYMIMFDGKPWGELYFNMTGYVAEHGIPVPPSKMFSWQEDRPVGSLNIGERPLSIFKSEIARANREWETKSASVKTADSSKPWKVIETVKNAYGHVLHNEVVAEFADERRAQAESRKLEQEQKAQSDGSLSSRLGRSEFHVNYDRTASVKTAALMMTGQYKQLVAASHELYQAYQKLDRAVNDLAKMINSPIEPEEKNSVMRSVMILRHEIEELERALSLVANMSIVIGDATTTRLSSENVASELIKIAKELTAKQVEAEMLWQKVSMQFGEKLAMKAHAEMLKQAANYSNDSRLNPDNSLWVNEFLPMILEGFNRQMKKMSADY